MFDVPVTLQCGSHEDDSKHYGIYNKLLVSMYKNDNQHTCCCFEAHRRCTCIEH